MPVANIHLLAGHPRPVLKQLVREAAVAYSEAMSAPLDKVQVWITEVDPALWAIAGVPADEAIAAASHAEVEVPFIRLLMLEGRSLDVVHKAMAVLTEVTARVLQSDPQRVRVEVQYVPAERWAIGGVPVSVARQVQPVAGT